MNTDMLVRAYAELTAAMRALPGAPQLAPDDEAEVDWRLCHIALSDEALIDAARATIEGLSAIVDNRRAMDGGLIASVIGKTTRAQRIDVVRRNGSDFVDRVAELSEAQSETAIRLVVHDRDGNPVSDRIVTWRELVGLRADRHLPEHSAKLRALGTEPNFASGK